MIENGPRNVKNREVGVVRNLIRRVGMERAVDETGISEYILSSINSKGTKHRIVSKTGHDLTRYMVKVGAYTRKSPEIAPVEKKEGAPDTFVSKVSEAILEGLKSNMGDGVASSDLHTASEALAVIHRNQRKIMLFLGLSPEDI